MRRLVAVLSVAIAPVLIAGGVRAQQGAAPTGASAASVPPAGLAWAYGVAAGTPLPDTSGARPGGPAPAPAPAPQAADPTPLSIPGSTLTFTRAQIRGGNGVGPADWFPQDHPTMPDVVAKGRGTDVRPCSLCHYPNGKGRPESAGVAGLPTPYFLQTLNDFRNDARKTGDPRKGNTAIMAQIAKGMTEEEMRQSAEYFGSMKWTPWIKVMETKTVPKTRIAGGMYLRLDGTETEPLGERIIETPENTERTETLRDPRSGFIAYVPVGSVKKGEALVMTGGNGKTIACGTCHGPNLTGLGPVPGLAGRSPSYLARQMYDIRVGARHGVWSELMKPVLAKLADEDYVNITAYLASRPAAATTATQ